MRISPSLPAGKACFIEFETSSLTIKPHTDICLQFGDFWTDPVGTEQIICQILDVLNKINPHQVLGLIQFFVDKCHYSDTALAFLEYLKLIEEIERERTKKVNEY